MPGKGGVGTGDEIGANLGVGVRAPTVGMPEVASVFLLPAYLLWREFVVHAERLERSEA